MRGRQVLTAYSEINNMEHPKLKKVTSKFEIKLFKYMKQVQLELSVVEYVLQFCYKLANGNIEDMLKIMRTILSNGYKDDSEDYCIYEEMYHEYTKDIIYNGITRPLEKNGDKFSVHIVMDIHYALNILCSMLYSRKVRLINVENRLCLGYTATDYIYNIDNFTKLWFEDPESLIIIR